MIFMILPSIFVPVEATTTRRSSSIHANELNTVIINQSTTPLQRPHSAPTAPPQTDPIEPETEDHLIPKDSTLTNVSEGPPRYRALFPPGYVPVISDEGLPPPPTYEESQRLDGGENNYV